MSQLTADSGRLRESSEEIRHCAQNDSAQDTFTYGESRHSVLLAAFCGIKKAGSDLLSHPVTKAVPWALEGLTSVFGMGTGVAPPPLPPGKT